MAKTKKPVLGQKLNVDPIDQRVIPCRRALSKVYEHYVVIGVTKSEGEAHWFAKGGILEQQQLAGATTSDIASACALLQTHFSSISLNMLIQRLIETGALAKHGTEALGKRAAEDAEKQVPVKAVAEGVPAKPVLLEEAIPTEAVHVEAANIESEAENTAKDS